MPKVYPLLQRVLWQKEYRDHLMRDYAQVYPHYGFDKNVGYGTKAHLAGLEQYGVTPIHRRTFEPVKSML